MKESTF